MIKRVRVRLKGVEKNLEKTGEGSGAFGRAVSMEKFWVKSLCLYTLLEPRKQPRTS